MNILCKNCGASYETKYKVCPKCGAVHSATPFYAKLLAIISGGFLALTLIMAPFGVFTFASTGDDKRPEDQSLESQLPGDNDSGKAQSEQEAEVFMPDASSEPLSEKTGLAIKADDVVYNDGDELVLYISKRSLQLDVYFPDGNHLDSELETEWESSNGSVFTVDGDGLLTVVTAGSAKLTVKYGSLSISIWVRIDNNKIYSTPTGTPAPTGIPAPAETPPESPTETPEEAASESPEIPPTKAPIVPPTPEDWR